ncbi:MAG: DUF58 domain-containing protein [Verrucomicrobiota bacterium]
MRPSNRLLLAAALWLGLGVAAGFSEPATGVWRVGGLVLAFALLVDGFWLLSLRKPVFRRFLPGRLAVGVPTEVRGELRNPTRWPGLFRFFDSVPVKSESPDLPWRGRVPPRGFARFAYELRVLERGRQSFERAWVHRLSPLGLWERKYRLGQEESAKVYPNYEPVVRFALLSVAHKVEQMGIVKKNLQGQSKDFHQLREYQEGDVFSQIDWKATSRRLQLISREYREERNQTLILMPDGGRRMRALDGGIAQFDHCLNAMLLLSYIALRQGDQVGVLGFGGTRRWLPPVKGQHSMNLLLNHLYDYETSLEPSDYFEAVERLLVHQKRRALVILLTNLRSEDSENVARSLDLLRQKHLVILASLREESLGALRRKPVHDPATATDYLATHQYLRERQEVFQDLRSRHIHVLDEEATQLPVAVANAYLEIKRAGVL